MENINPTWKVLNSIIFRLKAGQSVKAALQSSCSSLSNSLEKFLFQWSNGACLKPSGDQTLTDHQKILVQIIADGLDGAPILEGLVQLECDVRQAYQRELDLHVAKLPFLGMIPLMLLIGPAFLLLLVGPIMFQLLQELSK